MPETIVPYTIPLLIKKIYLENISGELQIFHNDAIKTLFFEDGCLARAVSSSKEELLGSILFEMGKIDLEKLHSFELEHSNSDEKFGKMLVQSRLVKQKEIFQALEFQSLKIAVSAFVAEAGEWNFIIKKPDFEDELKFLIRLPRVILSGMKRMKNIAFFKDRFKQFSFEVKPIDDIVKKYFSNSDLKLYYHLDISTRCSHEQMIKKLKIDEFQYWRQVISYYLLNILDFTPL